eukprot:scaffold14903_cov107-Isochrysis_galbana.AAC.7
MPRPNTRTLVQVLAAGHLSSSATRRAAMSSVLSMMDCLIRAWAEAGTRTAGGLRTESGLERAEAPARTIVSSSSRSSPS